MMKIKFLLLIVFSVVFISCDDSSSGNQKPLKGLSLRIDIDQDEDKVDYKYVYGDISYKAEIKNKRIVLTGMDNADPNKANVKIKIELYYNGQSVIGETTVAEQEELSSSTEIIDVQFKHAGGKSHFYIDNKNPHAAETIINIKEYEPGKFLKGTFKGWLKNTENGQDYEFNIGLINITGTENMDDGK